MKTPGSSSTESYKIFLVSFEFYISNDEICTYNLNVESINRAQQFDDNNCFQSILPRAVPDQITLSKAADDWSNPHDQPAARRMPVDL